MKLGSIISLIIVLFTVAPQGVTANNHVACGGNIKQCPQKDQIIEVLPTSSKVYGACCCSDEYFSYFSGQRKTKYGCSIWGASKTVNNECSDETDFSGAAAFCEGTGARLCTCNELLNKSAKGTDWLWFE